MDSRVWDTSSSLGRPERLQQALGAGARDQLLHADSLGDGDFASLIGEAIVAATRVVFVSRGTVAGFYDQAFGEKALDDAVESAGGELDFAAGLFVDLFENGVPVLFAV